jgi:diguanylate cyclase (GGDEF)-like protein
MHTDAPRSLRSQLFKPLSALQRWSASRPSSTGPGQAENPPESAADVGAAPLTLLETLTPTPPTEPSAEQTLRQARDASCVHDETMPAILWRGDADLAPEESPLVPPPENAALAPGDLEAAPEAPSGAPSDTPAHRPGNKTSAPRSPAVAGNALLHQRLSGAMEDAQRRSALGALVRLGVARLDEIGDAFGEAAVTQVLQHLLRRLTRLLEQVAPQATVHSLGDGMLVVLPRIERSSAAEALVRQMLDTLARPLQLNSQAVAVHGSAGLAIFPHDGEQPAQLLRAADVAWHQARSRGRNAYQFYAREIENRAQRRLALEARLRQAIIGDELQLRFQPRAEVRSGVLCGVEAVPLWQPVDQPEWRGSELLLLAEESALGEALAHWTVRAACAHLRQWRAGGLAAPQLSVPILPASLKQERLVQTLVREVRAGGIEPHALTLLLCPVAPLAAQTPQRLGRELCSALPRLTLFTEAGFRLALDGVATSACSLSALAQLPLAELRLDCQALGPLDDEAGSLRAAIIALGHRLGLRVAASGVETELQLDQLRHMGCDEFQGPLLSEALDAGTWLEVLTRTQQA